MAVTGPRTLVVLPADLDSEPINRVKYGPLVDAYRRHAPVVGVVDASLRGRGRLLNAARTFVPDRQQWAERFYQNVPAFRTRSRRLAEQVRRHPEAEVVLQVGCLADARWDEPPVPSVVYTDYTMALSARRPEAGRSPLTPGQLQEWLALERRAYDRAGHVLTRGSFVRGSLLDDYGLAADRVTAVGGGVGIDPLPPLPDRPSAGSRTVLFVGTQFHRKGGDRVLRAFAQVRRVVPDARLVMVVAEPVPAGFPLTGVDVRQVAGHADLLELYRTCDVFVLASRLETWGDVLLEAMTFGLPCVAVDDEGMREIVDDGVTGTLVPPDDDRAMADALGELLLDHERRSALGRAGRTRLEQRYTWDVVAAQLVDAARRVVGAR